MELWFSCGGRFVINTETSSPIIDNKALFEPGLKIVDIRNDLMDNKAAVGRYSGLF